jgi:hypothetical protein
MMRENKEIGLYSEEQQESYDVVLFLGLGFAFIVALLSCQPRAATSNLPGNSAVLLRKGIDTKRIKQTRGKK